MILLLIIHMKIMHYTLKIKTQTKRIEHFFGEKQSLKIVLDIPEVIDSIESPKFLYHNINLSSALIELRDFILKQETVKDNHNLKWTQFHNLVKRTEIFSDIMIENFKCELGAIFFQEQIKFQGIFCQPIEEQYINIWANYLHLIYFDLFSHNNSTNCYTIFIKNLEEKKLLCNKVDYDYFNKIDPIALNIIDYISKNFLIVEQFPNDNVENFFYNLAKQVNLHNLFCTFGPDVLNTYDLNHDYDVGPINFMNVINKIEPDVNYHTENILNNLVTILEPFVVYERTILKNVYKHEDYIAFKNISHHLEPALNTFFSSTEHKIDKHYYLLFTSTLKIHNENRSNIKDFLPAGVCYYHDKILMNTDYWKISSKYGRTWAIHSSQEVFLHELGHAFDSTLTDLPYIKNIKNSRYKSLSAGYDFKKHTKINFKISKIFTIKQKKAVNYYVRPNINIKKLKDKTTYIKFNWQRAQAESFAQSFSILYKWFVYGFNRADCFVLDAHHSRQRVILKTLMPTLLYLLNNLNWCLTGLEDNNVTRRKKNMIKQFLNNVETMPINLTNKKLGGSNKISQFKKPTMNKLIKKVNYNNFIGSDSDY